MTEEVGNVTYNYQCFAQVIGHFVGENILKASAAIRDVYQVLVNDCCILSVIQNCYKKGKKTKDELSQFNLGLEKILRSITIL